MSKRRIYVLKKDFGSIQSEIMTMALSLPVMTNWMSDEEIAKIDNDPTVISSLSIRKSATLKKELNINTKNEMLKMELNTIFSFNFRQQALDIPLQGFGVFELIWKKKGSLWLPMPIERDYRHFSFRDNKLIYLLTNEETTPQKAIYATYMPKFNRQLGRPLYNTLFWLSKFKKASNSFWMEYMERFSTPWVIGKTNSGDKDEMAENLYAMLSGDVAVIEDEDEVELKTPSQTGDFYQLSKYADDQIREVLLGGNLTGEVTGGSLASSRTHDDIRKDIAFIDEYILQDLITQTLTAIKEVNGLEEDIEVFLSDPDDLLILKTQRDLNIFNMTGGKYAPAKEYIESTYSIQLESVVQVQNIIPNRFALKNSIDTEKDHIEKNLPNTTALEEDLLKQIEKIFKEAKDFDDAQEKALQAFDTLDTGLIEEVLTHYIANAMLYGNAQIEEENPKG